MGIEDLVMKDPKYSKVKSIMRLIIAQSDPPKNFFSIKSLQEYCNLKPADFIVIGRKTCDIVNSFYYMFRIKNENLFDAREDEYELLTRLGCFTSMEDYFFGEESKLAKYLETSHIEIIDLNIF